VHLFLRATDTFVNSEVYSRASPIAWAPERDFLLVSVWTNNGGDARTAVFDPASDSIIDLNLGESFMWGRDSTEVVVKNGDRFEKRRIR
jgi:hypothetical protein